MNKYIGILEGLLFAVGDEGLTLEQIQDILEINEEEAKEIVNLLRNRYESDEYGIQLCFLGNSFKLATKKEHREYFQKLIETPGTNTLSQAALETLAIIAYNEPITVQEVDTIRGISSREMIRRLVAKGFVKEAGKSEGVGRATLFRTTKDFLDYFGLSTKEELPKFEEIKEQIDDTDLYESKYKEEV
jgi:segregation and condensation protein B